MELARLLQHRNLSEAEIQARTREIYDLVLGRSQHIRQGNFQSIHTRDLELLWLAYDRVFFDGSLRRAVADTPLRFRLSRRLTSAAGQATRRWSRQGRTERTVAYEISVSTPLLFQTFLDVDRPVTASGIPCRDRLEALQRVFEHELVHVSEMLVWTDSSCAASRFQSIARRLFGHREHTHQLITQRERAWTRLGLRVGDRVRFTADGQSYVGIVNRITRRATVLVEHPRGERFDDGRRYARFYVPLALLQPLPGKSGGGASS